MWKEIFRSLQDFFCPQDMIGLLRSNLGIFQLQEFVVWVFIDLPGVVIWQHIHTEKRADKILADNLYI